MMLFSLVVSCCLVTVSLAEMALDQAAIDKIVAEHNRIRGEAWGVTLVEGGSTTGGGNDGGNDGGKDESCDDSNDQCASWAGRGECQNNPGWMKKNCRKSCKVCGGGGGGGGGGSSSCKDDNGNCADWAKRGECQRNPGYMMRSCKKSCKQCSKKRSEEEAETQMSKRSVSVPKMKWSKELQRSATERANSCEYHHVPWSRGLGENMAWTTWQKDSAAEWVIDAVTRWESEKKFHRSRDGWGCFSNGSCLHYTAMIWLETNEVGCGIRNNCPGQKKIQVICHYKPQGNWQGMGTSRPKEGKLPE